MHNSVDELIDEYDELAAQILTSNYRYLAGRLQQWFELLETGDDGVAAHIRHLERKTNWSDIEKAVLQVGQGAVGSGMINIPTKRVDRLAFHLVLFRRMASGEMNILNFSYDYFNTGKGDGNQATTNMLDQLFEPFSNELRRYIRWAYDQPEPEDAEPNEPFASPKVDISAPDRFVTINHNAPEYHEIITGLEGIEEQIRGNNEIDPDQKGQALAEINASQALLKAPRVREAAIKVVVVGVLRWIARVFLETAMGTWAQALLSKIYAFFPGIL